MATLSSGLPTLVFVPGSWHKPNCYSKIIKLLEEQHGFRCVAITLPSTTGNPEATFKDDVDTARHAILTETNQGKDVVVVAHSYGGMVGNSAIKGFAHPKAGSQKPTTSSPKESSSSDFITGNTSGHVIGLILIASGFTLTGLAFMDIFFGHPPPQWKVNKETGFADIVIDPAEFFYHDLPKEEQRYWVSQLTTHSLKSLFEGREYAYAGWQDAPVWYIGTVEDKGLPVFVQRMLIGMARGMGGLVEHRELQTSHSPFLSQPQNTVDIMAQAIEAFMRRKSRDTAVSVSAQDLRTELGKATGPSVQALRPDSWFKLGVPLIFGRLLGWTVSLWMLGRSALAWKRKT